MSKKLATKDYVDSKIQFKELYKAFDGSTENYIPEAIDCTAIIFFIHDVNSNWSTSMLFTRRTTYNYVALTEGNISITWYGANNKGKFDLSKTNNTYITGVLIFK